jgi:hypothetical protein
VSLVLNVEILGEFKKLTDATQGAQNSLGGLAQKASNIGRTIKRVIGALGITLGLRAVVRGFKDAVAAAEEAQTANARIDAIAKSMNEFGNEAEKVTKRIKDYAEQQQFALGVDSESIKAVQAKLLTFRELTKTAGELGGSFDRATRAAIDMAAAGFGSAESNATQLGKALNDPIKGITALNRAGIQFTEDQKALIQSLVDSGNVLEAQDMILKEIESQVGGTAEATANATTKMQIAFNEVSEALGFVLLPFVEDFSQWIMNESPKIIKFFDELRDVSTESGEDFAELGGIIGKTTSQIDGFFRKLSGGQGAFGSIGNFITATIAGFGQLLFVAGEVGETIGLLLSGQFGKAFKNATSFGSQYTSFVRQQNIALESARLNMNTPVQQRSDNITINVNGANVTAQEIVDKLNKARQTNGSTGLVQ